MLNKNAIGYLSIVIAYVISGKAALMLALPPGYASAIFPPAGIAVAAAFIAGRRALPWVFLGSILLNIWVGYSASHQIDATGFAAASIIAAASVLQATVGGWALRRAVGYPAALDNVRAVFQFLLLAPLICLTSASLSVSGLWIRGIFDTGSLAGNWFSWWIGDTLGVMVLLPITMVFAGEPRALWRSRVRTIAVPMGLTLLLFVVLFLKANQWEQSDSLTEFRQVSEQSLSQIQAKLGEQTTLLIAMQGQFLHDANGKVTRQEFQRFTHNILHRFPEIQAMEWVPRIDASQRAAFEAAQRKDIPGFEIVELSTTGKLQRAGKHSQFYPVTYVEPVIGNELAIGFDLASNPKRQDALARSSANGLPVATEPIRLVQAGNPIGMLVIQSVKSNGGNAGVAIIVLKVHEFIDKILPSASAELQLRLIDSDDRSVMYDNFTSDDQKILFERTFSFASRHYQLQASPTATYFKQHRGWQSWGVLVMGTFGTGLLGALLLLGTGYTARIEVQVAERTRELKNSEEKFRSIFEGSNDAIMLLTENGFFDCNSHALELFGLGSKEELISMHPSQLSPPTQPDGRDSFTVANEKIATAFKTGAIRFEWMHRRKNGEDFPAEVIVSAFNYQGKRVLQATGRDITERKNTEERLRTLSTAIEQSPASVVITDLDANILYVNPQFMKVTGYTPAEAMGQNPRILKSGTMSQETYVEMWNKLISGQEWHGELLNKRKNGEFYWEDAHIAPVKNPAGKVTHYVAVKLDITARKQTEESLRQLNETLDQRVRVEVNKNREKDHLLIQQARLAAMGEMIGNIAHQWRQPLNALALLLANIKDAYEYKELNAAYLDIETAKGAQLIDKMSTTIDDFRNFFKPNKIKGNFDVAKAIEVTLELVNHSLKNHNITVQVECSHEIFANGYPNEFSQVLLNVFNNAKDALLAKKVPNGKIDIELGEERTLVWVAIRDNAGGIPADILPKIFDPYFTTKEKGTGIGLYMSKMIMEHMNGAIVASNVGDGAEFKVVLPKSLQ